ncbi:MAG: NAD(P)H-dependent oxidoreductase [Spirochaetes bacterium]|nr:NAD(P)H-dependent oxidoreductase [Spirochaetota bacterium]
MKASVILSHPYSESFNHAIFRTVCRTLDELNVEVFKHDLYLENFNPVLSVNELGTDSSNDPLVNQYTAEMMESDLLVFIHPNWWGQPPAILKGYIDRIFRPPHAYDFSEKEGAGGVPEPKLCGKYGIVFNTSNTAEERETDFFGDPLESIWKQCIFAFCGIGGYYRKMFRIVSDSDQALREKWLLEAEQAVEGIVRDFSKTGG